MKFLYTLVASCATGILFAQTDSLPGFHLPEDSNGAWQKKLIYRKHLLVAGPDISYGESYRILNSALYPELTAQRNLEEKPSPTFSAGFIFTYYVNRYFQLQYGLHLLQTGFQLDEELHLSDTLKAEFGAACDVYHSMDPVHGFAGSFTFTDPRYNFFLSGYHPSEEQLHIDLRYTYIDIPVMARIMYPGKRIYGFLSSGLTANLMIWQTINETFDAETIRIGSVKVNEIPTAALQKWNACFTGQAGFGFRYNRRTLIEPHFGFEEQFRNIFNQKESYVNGYSEKHYRIDFGIYFCYLMVNSEEKK